MNVKLAFQTLSLSVYNSLMFLKDLPTKKIHFEGCEATANFCLQFNNIADLLNCKNRYANGAYSCPLTRSNYDTLKSYAVDFQNYICSIQDETGTRILETCRKTGFLGLLINLENMFSLFDILEPLGVEYLLTYKLCQDYLETFFSAIRSRGGFNNNPNAIQFKSAYQRLLIRHELSEVENGNCIFDGIDILVVSSKHKENTRDPIEVENVVNSCVDFDHDYITSFVALSPFSLHVVESIAGYVASKILDNISCIICKQHI